MNLRNRIAALEASTSQPVERAVSPWPHEATFRRLYAAADTIHSRPAFDTPRTRVLDVQRARVRRENETRRALERPDLSDAEIEAEAVRRADVVMSLSRDEWEAHREAWQR
jgi:hypothetical protein